MMVQRRMHDLMSQCSGQGRRIECFNEVRVVVKRHAVGGHRLNEPALESFQAKQE